MNFEKGVESFVIQEAKKRQKRFGTTKPNVVSVNFVFRLLNDLRDRSVSWSVKDFEDRAKNLEELEAELFLDDSKIGVPSEYRVYDRSKFNEALLLMIRNHDANIGISWDVIDVYLNRYCIQTKSA